MHWRRSWSFAVDVWTCLPGAAVAEAAGEPGSASATWLPPFPPSTSSTKISSSEQPQPSDDHGPWTTVARKARQRKQQRQGAAEMGHWEPAVSSVCRQNLGANRPRPHGAQSSIRPNTKWPEDGETASRPGGRPFQGPRGSCKAIPSGRGRTGLSNPPIFSDTPNPPEGKNAGHSSPPPDFPNWNSQIGAGDQSQ